MNELTIPNQPSVGSSPWDRFVSRLRYILRELNRFSHLCFPDTPTAASANNGSTSISQSNNDLDIFGPMVSNPLPASTSAAQFTQVNGGESKREKEAKCLLV